MIDTVNVVRGLLAGVRNVYPQLEDLDFERDIPSLEVPVYFFTSRYDETCVQDIEWRYFESLEAPETDC